MIWMRRIVICVIATTFFAILTLSAGKFASVSEGCSVSSNAAARLETVRDCNSLCELLKDREEACKDNTRHVLRAQVLADFGLLIAYSALTAALFLHIASTISISFRASVVKSLGLLLASGMLVCDAAENFLQLHLLGGSFCPPAVCSAQETFHWLGIFNPAKWGFLVASALALAILNLLIFRGVGRVVLAALYASAVVQGYESLYHRDRGFQSFLFVLALAWLGSMLQSFGADRLNRWRDELKDLAVVVKPCRFSLITAVVVVGALAFLPQGHDLLAHLAEEKNPLKAQVILAFAGLFTLGVICWYTARVALYIRFGDTPSPDTSRLKFLRKWVPRWIGALPFVGMCIANLLVLTFIPGDQPFVSWHLGEAALLCLVLGAIFMALVIARRSILNKLKIGRSQALDIEAYTQHASFKNLVSANTGTLIALAVIAVLSLLLFVALAFASFSIHVAPALGAVAVVFFAAAMWLPLGSYLAYLGHRHQFPLLTLLLVLVPLLSLVNDNHRVRTLKPRPNETSMEEELKRWVTVLDQKEPQEKKHPLVIVTTEGGGIRAAYWTATILAKFQDDEPTFSRHVFAISSVSGGSLGAGVFTALVADSVRGKQGQGKFTERAKAILGEDLLSSDLGALLSGEFLQRFLPFPVSAWDRSLAIERSWEKAYQKDLDENKTHPSTLSQSFIGLWSDEASDWVPRLALNSTWVETGRRVIITPFAMKKPQCSSLFIDSFSLPSQGQKDLPLSSAIHNSARFPYVSPPGRLDDVGDEGGHVVDGGLFDNSGASTALELAACLQKAITTDPELKPKVGPILIVGIVSNPEEENNAVPPTNILVDALASPEALWNARDARASFAVASLRLTPAVNEDTGLQAVTGALSPAPELATPPRQNELFIQFGLSDMEGNKKLLIPLGWQLSTLAQTEIANQVNRPGNVMKIKQLKARLLVPPNQ